MKIEKKIYSKEKFYETLLISLDHEINQGNKKKVKVHEGYKFNKNLLSKSGRKYSAKMEVLTLDENKLYKIKIQDYNKETIISYKFYTDDNGDYLLYEEAFSTEEGRIDFNQKVVSFLIGPLTKRKIKKRINQINDYNIKNRNEG